MTSTSHVVRAAVLIAAVLLLLPAAASAASHAGHIDLQDGLTLAQQFGYAPDYRQHVVTFDAGNVPSIRSRGASEDDTSFVQRLEDGVWVRHDLLDALRAAYPDFAGTVHAGGYGTDRIDWDVDGRAYTVLTIRLDDDGGFRNVLMASVDGCQTWQVLELPFGNDTPQTDPYDWGNVTAEHDTGRLLEGPPLIAVWKQLGPWRGQWSSLNQLQVLKPRWDGGMLTLQQPVTVSTLALTLLQCSGGASFAVTRGDKSYFVYSTVAPRGTRTTPAYAATYDLATNTVGPSTLVARSRPANDLHCTPGICMDSAGTLHVVTGAHGKPFRYARSTAPLSTVSWTGQVDVLSSGYRDRTTDADGAGRQTYLSMVCGPDDVLHIACRQTRRNVDSHYPGVLYDALVHQSLAPGQTTWSRPDLIVVPPQPYYSQYYQKLTVDRLGRLFVSCSYFSRRDPPATRYFRRFHHRMVLISQDGGRAWRFATTADLVAGIPSAGTAAAGPAEGGPVTRGLRLAVVALLFATAASLTAAAADSPILLDSRRSLRAQFQYAPEYERNLPSFDAANRAYIRGRTATQDDTGYAFAQAEDGFRGASLLEAVRRAYPRFRRTINAGGWAGEAIEADALGRLYTLLQVEVGDGSLRNLLLYSTDAGWSWRVLRLPFTPPRRSPDGRNDGTCASEHLAGFNLRGEPPLVAVWQPVGDWPGYRACRMALYVLQPRFEGDRLVLPDPVPVSDRALGLVQAAGGASFAATVGATTYIVWAEVAPPDAPGSPVFVAAYDQTTGTLGAPQQVATARPLNDDHTTPGIVADSKGLLHVLSGGHNSPFMYTHTTDPADPASWSPQEPVLMSGYVRPGEQSDGSGCQTYASLVCTPDDALVVVFRQRRRGVDAAFGGQPYQALSVQRLDPGGSWSEARRIIYCGRHRGYAQYYQKMTVDRRGRLFLSLSYFRPHDWPRDQRAANRYHQRMILISEDGGGSWRFATLGDFLQGVLAD